MSSIEVLWSGVTVLVIPRGDYESPLTQPRAGRHYCHLSHSSIKNKTGRKISHIFLIVSPSFSLSLISLVSLVRVLTLLPSFPPFLCWRDRCEDKKPSGRRVDSWRRERHVSADSGDECVEERGMEGGK